MATIRNLKIKTSTCNRIVKELHSYEKEVEREAAKTADMKDKGADPYDLKQQENVLGESRMMIPDCHKRLEAALADLKSTLKMESKRVVMLVTIMIMGNLLNQIEAQKIPFQMCFPACLITCKAESKFPKYLLCPFTCTKTCLQQPSLPSTSSNKIDDASYFCKLGCATHHCVSLSSLQNPNLERVSACVDSCSNKCTRKY